MSRSEKINKIIESRKPIAEDTLNAIHKLRRIGDELRHCSDTLVEAMKRPISEEKKARIGEKLAKLDRFINDLLPKRARELDQLQRRFSRSTLNIGVVGNAGQGKSTLLQKLTGLKEEEIPTGAKGDCTGAPAIIENADVDEAYAYIDFFTESEFLEHVVGPYYHKFNLPKPSTLSTFSAPLPEEVRSQQTLYDEVRFIEMLQNHLGEYREFFAGTQEHGDRQLRIAKNEIRKYTAKRDKDDNLLSIWAAVKSARIFCRFPSLRGERISVGDTPGLGDRAVIEAEERLMKDFGRNIDAVMMLRKVRERGIRKEDVRLFSLVKAAIPELPAEKWSSFIVNVFPGDRSTEATRDALKFLPEDFRNSSLKEIDEYIELDCNSEQEVGAALDRLLNVIASNQGKLDRILYKARFEEMQKTLDDVAKLASELKGLFPQNSGSDKDVGLAEGMYRNRVRNRLAYKLQLLVNAKKAAQKTANEAFLNAVNEVARKLETIPGLPENERELEETAAAENGMASTFGKYCQNIRHLTVKEFDCLDMALQKIFSDLRNEAKECFTAEDGGKLGHIEFSQTECTEKESEEEEPHAKEHKETAWWISLAKEIAELGDEKTDQENAKLIAESIRQFASASLTFRGLFMPRVQPCFNTLNPDHQDNVPYAWMQKLGPTELIENLRRAGEHSVARTVKLLQDSATEPSISLFATIEDLHESVFRTGGADSATTVLSKFYANHRNEIWHETFVQQETDAKFHHKWHGTVKQLENTVKE